MRAHIISTTTVLATVVGCSIAYPSRAAETGIIEEVVAVATPIRDSQRAAIESKRSSNNVVDILAADTIGRFPDQNLADSLGRVPGLAIERDQGQARFINFRGAPFRYTKIAFDGVDVLGAEDGRTPRFDAFPAVVTSRIAVNKAVTPAMPGEATVGFVNIETFKPFDREGFSFSGEVGRGNQELGDVDIDKYNGRLSFSNERFGIAVFGSHNLRGRITDNREYEYEDTDGDGIDDSVINLDFRSYRGEREDNAYGGRVDFKLSDTVDIFFSSLYSEFIDREERNQFDFDFAPVPLGTSAYLPIIEVSRLLEDGEYENSTFTNTLGLDASFGAWDVSARLNYTQTENNTDLPLPLSVGGVVGGTVNVGSIENPSVLPTQVDQPGTTVDVNQLDYAATLGLVFAGELDTDATKVMSDAARTFEFGGRPTEFRFGFQYDTREAEGGDVLVFGGFPDSIDINDFVTSSRWDSDFNNTIDAANVNNVALRNAWAAAVGGLGAPFDDDTLIEIDEDVIAVFAMGTTEFSWGSLVYGARIEQTDFTSSGFLVGEEGELTPVSTDNDYTNVLPSAHLNVDMAEDLKLRLSLSTGISRPRYTEIRASQTVDPVELVVSGGNPELDPEESIGVDVALEWYFADASLLSVGGYHRQIDNVIYASQTTVDGSIYAPGLIAPGTPTEFNSFFNGDDGELTGFEVNFIGSLADVVDGPIGGLGFSGNVTWIDSEFTAPTLDDRTFSLPGTSDLVYNASLFYERYGLSLRVNYQYRDDWLSTTENDSLSEFWAETERVDASVRYTLPNPVYGMNLTLALNANNLSDERDVRFINSRRTPNQVEGFGRRWVFSVRADF
ncbi:MAG: TonB-dependent receptor [Pseudomonadota bacterium]